MESELKKSQPGFGVD